MSVFLAGMALFVAAFALHVIVWRLRVPRRQLAALVMLFATTMVGGLVACAVFGLIAFGLTPLRLVLAVGLFGAFSVIYFILFSALESDSLTVRR